MKGVFTGAGRVQHRAANSELGPILLRGMPRLAFGATFRTPEETARIFAPDTPIAIAENDCLIVAGQSLLNAFDRLEVAEYSAKAVIAAESLGTIVAIDDERIREIEAAFKL